MNNGISGGRVRGRTPSAKVGPIGMDLPTGKAIEEHAAAIGLHPYDVAALAVLNQRQNGKSPPEDSWNEAHLGPVTKADLAVSAPPKSAAIQQQAVVTPTGESLDDLIARARQQLWTPKQGR